MRHTRLIALILLAASLPGCTSFRPVPNPVVGLQPAPDPVKEARVTLRTGTRILLDAPHVDGDSIRGMAKSGQPLALALADISYIEMPKPNGTKSFFFALMVAGLAVVLGLLLHSATSA